MLGILYILWQVFNRYLESLQEDILLVTDDLAI